MPSQTGEEGVRQWEGSVARAARTRLPFEPGRPSCHEAIVCTVTEGDDCIILGVFAPLSSLHNNEFSSLLERYNSKGLLTAGSSSLQPRDCSKRHWDDGANLENTVRNQLRKRERNH